jgi:hypothetical protein
MYNQVFKLFNPTPIFCRIRKTATNELGWIFLQRTAGGKNENEINYWYSHMTNSGGVRLKWISARKKILPSYQRMIKHMISRLNYESPVHSSFTHTLKKRGKSQNSSLISSSPCIKSSEFQQANIKDWYSGLVRPNNIKYSLKLNFQ